MTASEKDIKSLKDELQNEAEIVINGSRII